MAWTVAEDTEHAVARQVRAWNEGDLEAFSSASQRTSWSGTPTGTYSQRAVTPCERLSAPGRKFARGYAAPAPAPAGRRPAPRCARMSPSRPRPPGTPGPLG